MKRLLKRPRMAFNRNNTVLFDYEVLNIRKMYATGSWSYKELALMYNVNRMTITNVVKGKTYVDAGAPMFRGFMTDGQVREIRRLYATKRYTQDTLAAQYEVSRPTIWRIIHHRTYTDVI